MNIKIVVAMILLLPLESLSQQKYSTTITDVTLFRTGAQINRTANISLKKGENKLVIANLPDGIDDNTMQLSTLNKAYISEVSYSINQKDEITGSPEYEALRDRIKVMELERENENIVFSTLSDEELLILSNKEISGADAGVTATQLNAVADLYRSRLLQVKKLKLESKRKLDKINEDVAKINMLINELSAKGQETKRGEVYVTIYSNESADTKLNLSYYDYRASWTTHFDLRLESLQKPLVLNSRAAVNQTTGENWDQVNVRLTTANPSLNNVMPILQPWFLYYYVPYAYGYQNNVQIDGIALAGKAKSAANMRQEADKERYDDVQTRATTSEVISFTEHVLPNKMNIPSDNKTHDISLGESNVEADYQYVCVPKLDSKAYLTADIINWEQYNLSSGEMKLYFEGTYVGKSYLDVNAVSDTLTLSLGPDIAIQVKKEKRKDETKTSFLSSKREEKLAYDIIVKNNKPGEINIKILDQLPIMTESSMELDVQEISGAKQNKETGMLEWKLNIKPGEQVKKRVTYSVKIPKDKKVTLKY